MSHVECGNQELNPDLMCVWQGPIDLSQHLLPPMVCVRRKLELKVEPDSNLGIMAFKLVALSARSNVHA